MDQRLATEWVRDNIAQFGGKFETSDLSFWAQEECILTMSL
jgi:hypothetical protein